MNITSHFFIRWKSLVDECSSAYNLGDEAYKRWLAPREGAAYRDYLMAASMDDRVRTDALMEQAQGSGIDPETWNVYARRILGLLNDPSDTAHD